METSDTPLFKNANDFSMHIEKMAIETKSSYLEVILSYCEEHMLDPEEVAPIISKSLREKLASDFRHLNYLPKLVELEL